MCPKEYKHVLLSEIEIENGIIINSNWIKLDNEYYRIKINNKYVIFKKLNCKLCDNLFLERKYNYKKGIKNNYNFYCSTKCRNKNLNPEQDFTKKLNLYETYYLLGLITTDGYISKISSKISIGLNKKDEDLLYKIQKIFNGNILEQKDKRKNRIGQNYWIIYNYNVKNHLNSIGITPAKSLTLNIDNWFNTLSYEQKLCFVLGCIDGDGCVYLSKTNKITLYFCSSSFKFFITIYNFLNEILRNYTINYFSKVQIRSHLNDKLSLYEKEFFKNNNLKFYNTKYYKHKNYRLEYTNQNVVKILLSEIYSTLKYNSLFLKRKYDKAKIIIP